MYFSVASETYLSHFGEFQVVVRLTYRLKATVRRLFRYRLPPRTLHPLRTQKTGSIPPTTLIFSTSAKIPEFRIAVSVHECYLALNLAQSGGPPMGDLS